MIHWIALLNQTVCYQSETSIDKEAVVEAIMTAARYPLNIQESTFPSGILSERYMNVDVSSYRSPVMNSESIVKINAPTDSISSIGIIFHSQ